MQTLKTIATAIMLATLASVAVDAQTASRNVAYHSQDIVAIRAKVKYTTLIVIPATEKIMEAATGDKDFWIVDVVGNFCFVHPAKPGISSNLNLITDKGNIYSFTLTDITDQKGDPDLKVIIQPADPSNIVAANGPAQYVPVVQLEQARQQISTLESHVGAAVDEYKSAYPTELKFDYVYKRNEAPFDIQSIYHDDKFTYIKTNAQETTLLNALADFIPEEERIVVIEDTSELRIGKPNLLASECQTESHTGTVNFNDLLKAALRWRPDRIILGEVRGDEARTLLDSFNTGHAGSMATIHASSAVKALRRFGELAMRSHQQTNRDDISAEIAETVQIVTQVG